MGALTYKDRAAVHDLALKAYACDGLDSLRSVILPELRRLVPGDMLGYNDLDLPAGRVTGIIEPSDATFTGIEERFAATAHQHPGVRLVQGGDYRPHLLSDFLTTQELHRLDLYHEVYRPLGSEDQIYFNLAPPAMVTIVINRSRRSFSQRDREVINLLQPHLGRAFMQVLHRERTRALIAAQEAKLQESDAAVILLDSFGSVVHASPLALDLLADYYPGERDVDGVLPVAVTDWLRANRPGVPETSTIVGRRGTLRIRATSGLTTEGWQALLLDEQRSPQAPTVNSLRSLGLTDRQAQVLGLLCAGCTTQKIADELYLSPATVRKHLENVYARLGVRSRTEAVAIAIRQRPV